MTLGDPRSALYIDRATTARHTTLTMQGVLDGSTYLSVRDAVLKAALDAPPLIVVDVTALQAPSPSAWAVFTSARWLVGDWPDIPIGLVCSHAVGRRALARNGIARYLPVYGSVAVATDAMAARAPAPRRRVRQVWPASPSAVASTRNFVAYWLRTWSQDGLVATASVVTTVLVENVLRHTGSDPDVRLETDGVTVTVAVTDGNPAQACVHEEDEALGVLSELQIVRALTRVWGNTPISDGKVVWAVMGPENRL
jgi:hypothetical protein